MKRITIILFSIVFVFYSFVHAQENNSGPLEQKVHDVMSLFRADPGNYEKYFSSDFLSHVAPAKLTDIFTYFYKNFGKCIREVPDGPVNGFFGKFHFIFEKNTSVPVSLTVDASEPHLIIGLLLGNPVSTANSFSDIIKEFKNLPGQSSLLIIKVSGNNADTLASYNPKRELAIGSAFKLYILSELLRTINNGKHKWSEVVHLNPEYKSLPSGFLQKWPAGSPLTLHSLAALMISQSDNTAADELLHFLGRKNVEKMLKVTGHSRPALDIPFLSTSEMFKLKGELGMKTLHKYLSMPAEKKRELLNNTVSKISLKSITFLPKPVYIDSVEWFASPADLCRVMNWLLRNSKSGPGAEVRKILSINPGLSFPEGKWKYIGYKGGSEPGVLDMTYLLQLANGNWYEFSAGWNNTAAPLNEGKFFELVESAVGLIK